MPGGAWEFAFESSTSCRVTDQLCHTLATSVPRVVGAPVGGGGRHREAASGLLHIATWSSCRSRAARRQIDLFAQFPAANDAFSMTFRAHANLLTTLLPSPLFQLLSTLCMQSQAKRSVLYSQRRNRRRCVEKADVITGISNVACDIYDTLRSERVGQRRQRNIIRLIISSVPSAMCALCGCG